MIDMDRIQAFTKTDVYLDQLREMHKDRRLRAHVRNTKARATEHGWDFDLDLNWLQAGCEQGCALTGIQFVKHDRALCASIDRIDNSKGYTKDNCRIILNCINCFKGTMTDKQMMTIAKALTS